MTNGVSSHDSRSSNAKRHYHFLHYKGPLKVNGGDTAGGQLSITIVLARHADGGS
jgi:hypothetical protein